MRMIQLAHSPDADDAFMFYALAEGKVRTGPVRFVHILQDIETLNQRALRGELEVTAVSIHAYAYLADRYLLLPHGASMGDRYGPRIIARAPIDRAALRGRRVAVPGPLTSATLALRLYAPEAETVDVHFDRIGDAVRAGDVDAGVLIHEGQLTYAQEGFHLVADLGEWWHEETGLPLPLGANAVRRDLGEHLIGVIAEAVRASIEYSLAHRDEALDYALGFGRGLDRAQADEFVGMYVNRRTVEMGDEERRAITEFLGRGHDAGILPRRVEPEFAGRG
jgi:1,4-dihydroxy-6-naphthoate synthase